MEIQQFENVRYVTNFPEEYSGKEKYPVILFLHGAGSRGNDIKKILNNPYFKIIREHERFPFISVAPQCSENTWFDMFETLKRFVLNIAGEEYADENKIYLMGVSMGGYATWQLAMSMPEYFAAIVPICGGGMYWNAERLINVPIWAFHGQKDVTVHLEESKKMVDAVNRYGGNAMLTIYSEAGHDAWSDTYRNMEVFEWMLSQTNTNDIQIQNIYDDSTVYG
ncbi:MAG: prolyl oligopeptidase family serine peptidase [Lachnospiraceae bacterium]|nr:prolyl oligopeptidase family serine peptidase [Lachnospiraceae bacterium]